MEVDRLLFMIDVSEDVSQMNDVGSLIDDG